MKFNIMDFRSFFISEQKSEEEKNLQKTISRLPKDHQKLLKGYQFKFQSGNTLKGDNQHIGVVEKNKITVAAPWKYGREFCVLHEIAHVVWQYKITPELKKEWEALIQSTKNKQKKYSKNKEQNISALAQNSEEIFAMAYAQTYSDAGMVKYDNQDWVDFIKKI